jgi:rhodanese-related sulfurtransferase
MASRIGQMSGRAILLAALFLAATAPFLNAGSKGILDPEEVITVDELRGLQEKKTELILFDARSQKSHETARITGAVLPLTDDFYQQMELFRQNLISAPPDRQAALKEGMQRYPKDTRIVTYCNRDCQASTVLLLELKRLGFKNVQAMEEGFEAWQEKGYPTVSGLSPSEGRADLL